MLVCFTDFSRHLWQVLAVVAIIIVVSVPIVFPRLLMPLLGLGLRLAPKRRRLWAKARRAIHSMAELSHWRTYGLTLVPSVAGWAAEGLALYLLLRFFGADVSALNAIFVFSFSMIVGAASMLPGGLGSTEVTAVVLLTALGVRLRRRGGLHRAGACHDFLVRGGHRRVPVAGRHPGSVPVRRGPAGCATTRRAMSRWAERELSGWGRVHRARCLAARPERQTELAAVFASEGSRCSHSAQDEATATWR